MRAQIEAKAFAAALKNARQAIPVRSTVPILGNVLIEAGEGITLTVTDMDTRFTQKLEAEVYEAGREAVELATLATFADGVSGSVAIASNGPRLGFSANQSRCDLGALPADNFPAEMGFKEDFLCEFTIPAEALSGCLRFCETAMCAPETKPFLQGVNIRFDGNLVFAATDGGFLQKIEIEPPLGSNGIPEDTIIPDRSVSFIAKTISGDALVRIGRALITVESGSGRFVSRLIEGSYPNIENAIPRTDPEVISCDLAALKTAVQRVASIANDGQLANLLFFSSGTTELTIRGANSIATIEERLVCKGVAAEWACQAKYVRDALFGVSGDVAELSLHLPQCMRVGSPGGTDKTTLVFTYARKWPQHLEAA
ncbi:MAG: DNA polymerase III subunit beta [Methyloceanibacter sp.]|nr:DNA polymerase III subunit beta [Methyloceanibacter sp.]